MTTDNKAFSDFFPSLKRSWGNDGFKARELSGRAIQLNNRMVAIGGHVQRGIGGTGKGWEVWFPSEGGSVTSECNNLNEVMWDVEAFEEQYSKLLDKN
tara:strand:- start:255 stop:548 length:294 start_codon:yes stop_codon:yes gene_type:complete